MFCDAAAEVWLPTGGRVSGSLKEDGRARMRKSI